ncbi:MAG: hypothetical protein QM811_16800 [Pirellulales bacterium]
MANNTAAIAAIDKILRAGATTVTIDGRSVTYDFAELRRQRRELIESDDAQTGRRPVVSTVSLGNC